MNTNSDNLESGRIAGTPGRSAASPSATGLSPAGKVRPYSADVIVLGAGLAGLGAARAIANAGKSVILIDGRDRVGGRVLTARDSHTAYPIELGPEWVGADGALRDVLDRVNADVRATYGAHLVRHDGAIVERESWKRNVRTAGSDSLARRERS